MKRIYLMAVAVLMIFCFVGTAGAQRKKGSQGKRIEQLDIVISEVGEATIGYQVERRGRMRTTYIGVADVTRVQKAEYKDVALKDSGDRSPALESLVPSFHCLHNNRRTHQMALLFALQQ